jgi:Calcineurin-like phosphoesterase
VVLTDFKNGLAFGTKEEHKGGMGFRFIHTADWQLGRAFGTFEAGLAGQLEAARFDAIDRIAGVASTAGAAHVLVAGDVFDSPDIASRSIRQGLERMRRHPQLSWVLLPGNHDPARPGGIWDRVRSLGLPANVVVVAETGAHALTDEVVVLAAPLTNRAVIGDPTAFMDDLATPPGVIRIGLAHGSVQDFGSQEASVSINAGRAQAARLDYLALGDWHGLQKIGPRTWYSGTPEPDRFKDNSPGFALAVTLDGVGAPPGVTPCPTGQFIWADEGVELHDIADLEPVERALLKSGAPPNRILAKVALTGSLPASQHGDLGAWRDDLDGRFHHIDIDTSGVGVRLDGDDLGVLGEDRALRTAAERLRDMAGAGDERAVRALAMLFDLTRRAREGVS